MRQPAFPHPNNNQLENKQDERQNKDKYPYGRVQGVKKKKPVKNRQRVRTNSQKLKYKYPVKYMKRYSRKK